MNPHEDIQILFLGSGPFSVNRRIGNDKFTYFSKYYSSDYIGSVEPTVRMTRLRSIKLEENVTLHPFLYYFGNTILRNLHDLFYWITKALKLYYIEGRKWNVVISGNPLLTGLTALLISRITGSKTIIEVNGNFEAAFKYGKLGTQKPSQVDQIKGILAKYLISFVVKRADQVKLLSKYQLKAILDQKQVQRLNVCTFHDFVPIRKFLNQERKDQKYLLLLGFPWYLKGVDILIQAFKKISDEFPEYRLKIVGWCPEGKEYFEELAKGNQKIELLDPVPYKDVIPIMANCSVYILASRTEAMGRVLLEAMASKKPIIASNVGGVTSVVKDGFNGLLFKKENVVELAEKIKMVLSDRTFAERLANNGFDYVQDHLSEAHFILNYRNMIENLINPGSPYDERE